MLFIVGQPAGLMSSPMGREEGVGGLMELGAAVKVAFGLLIDMAAEAEAEAFTKPKV